MGLPKLVYWRCPACHGYIAADQPLMDNIFFPTIPDNLWDYLPTWYLEVAEGNVEAHERRHLQSAAEPAS